MEKFGQEQEVQQPDRAPQTSAADTARLHENPRFEEMYGNAPLDENGRLTINDPWRTITDESGKTRTTIRRVTATMGALDIPGEDQKGPHLDPSPSKRLGQVPKKV